MLTYQPEELKPIRFHGRLIYVTHYPEWKEQGVVLNHVIDQLGFGAHKEDLLQQTIYDLKYLAQVVHVEDASMLHELVVIPISKFNAWLFSLRADIGDDVWFNQEVITDDGEIQEEAVNVRENLRRYQAECCAVLYSYWTNGIALNPNAGQPFAGLTSLWRASRENLDKMIRKFADYAEQQGESLDVPTLKRAIHILLTEFLPEEIVRRPEESQNGYDLYRLALAEDFIARYFNQAIIDGAYPTQCITTLDSDMIVAFHTIASGLLQSVNDWQMSIPGK